MQYRTFSLVLVVASLAAMVHPVAGLSLLDRSPFVWPGFEASKPPAQAQKPATAPGDLEFHAVYELSGKTHILVKDRRQNKFHWLSLGEEADGMLPKEYNPDKDELLLAYDNQEKWLSLQGLPEASGTPVALASPTPTASASSSTTTPPRRRVIRPTSSSSSTRNVIRPTSRTGQTAVSPRIPTRRSTSRSAVQPTEKDIERFRSFDVPPPPSTGAPSLGDLQPPDVDLPVSIDP
jgi:hypothetical protein